MAKDIKFNKQMTEIGGYFSLEIYKRNYHKNGILLNSARNALRYILQAHHIKELFVPYYTCPVIFSALEKENCKIYYYDINKKLLPSDSIAKNSFILYNDYFGICMDNVQKMTEKYSKIIIDNAQSFYAPARGIACFYSPRKFFGLPDGGIAITNKKLDVTFEKDISYKRMSHLIMRPDIGAEAAYAEFKHNDSKLDDLPIREMSCLTRMLMGNINYRTVKTKRRFNFYFLHKRLKTLNELNVELKKENVPMVYPLLSKKPGLREFLIEHKIYVAKYWSGLTRIIPSGSFSNYLTENLLPLPIDQRYGVEDMKRIVEVIDAFN